MAPTEDDDFGTRKGRRTRERLLEAGVLIAREHGPAGLSVAAVTSRAGVAKGTFYVHFRDRDGFLEALRHRALARAGDAVDGAVAGLEPGTELLNAAIEAYLDHCLTQLPLDRHGDDELPRRIQSSLKAIGIRPSRPAARLVMAMAQEVARTEQQAGHPVGAARKAIAAMTAPR